eukprot:tig00001415_g8669.t1
MAHRVRPGTEDVHRDVWPSPDKPGPIVRKAKPFAWLESDSGDEVGESGALRASGQSGQSGLGSPAADAVRKMIEQMRERAEADAHSSSLPPRRLIDAEGMEGPARTGAAGRYAAASDGSGGEEQAGEDAEEPAPLQPGPLPRAWDSPASRSMPVPDRPLGPKRAPRPLNAPTPPRPTPAVPEALCPPRHAGPAPAGPSVLSPPAAVSSGRASPAGAPAAGAAEGEGEDGAGSDSALDLDTLPRFAGAQSRMWDMVGALASSIEQLEDEDSGGGARSAFHAAGSKLRRLLQLHLALLRREEEARRAHFGLWMQRADFQHKLRAAAQACIEASTAPALAPADREFLAAVLAYLQRPPPAPAPAAASP